MVEGEPGPLGDDLLNSNGLHMRERSQAEDRDDQSTPRTGQEDRRQGQVVDVASNTPDPSSGVNANTTELGDDVFPGLDWTGSRM